MAADPLDPMQIQSFTDVDSIEDKILERCRGMYPELVAVIIHKTVDTAENTLYLEVNILMPGGKHITKEVTLPIFSVKPLNKDTLDA